MNEPSHAHEVLAVALHALIADARAARARVLAVSASALAQTPGGPTDEEALHDFRVALRRMRTILRVAREVWRRKRLARIEGEIRYHAQATGMLRDEEVLRETLAALDLPPETRAEVDAWLNRRDRTVRKEHADVTRLLRDGPPRRAPTLPNGKHIRPLERSFHALAARLDGDTPRLVSTVDLGHAVLDHAARDVVTWAMRDVGDTEAMHELRIRYKRLRYTAELFAEHLGATATRFAKHATRMQRHLGELHDIDHAIVTLSRARGLDAASKGAVLAALHAARVRCASKVEPHLVEARSLMDRGPDDETPLPV
ncbi:CHAD domain-containing protein [Polyangium sp. y55x31]|uniref:CHAD domain-containing protein n=1 Tax=Polyangium sp. y55x31 TaxID=3042688 RepID=UPI002482B6B8|nr:CHAD domain-containing protein [Polyangium sp. y55x31]MDI1478640.1 CHAD domain-containing protein [Polyangium sp. y55x31]